MDLKTINKFKKWLKDRGCEILPNTNEYEALRWKGKYMGVLYESGKFSSHSAEKAFNCYKKGKTWDDSPDKQKVGSGKKAKLKRFLLERDGTKCFYCDEELENDISIEHLIPLSMGGHNTPANTVLTHNRCNNDVGNIPIIDKIKLVISNRINKILS